jgi:excinuclease ABC subunit C
MIDDDLLNHLPENSGVYLFRDKEKEILYVGKAKNLRDRVRSYFKGGKKDNKTERLLGKIDDVSYILTRSETEAFLLENNLIKEHQPKYNIVLKDDKTYISLKLTLSHQFPALAITRRIQDDGALYFGPYPHAREVRDILKLLQSLYPLRRCTESVFARRTKPCLLHPIGKCCAPCVGAADESAYRTMVDELVDFLSGKDEKLLKGLQEGIERAAESWNFEEAQARKERYLAVKRLVERQRVHQHLGRNRDAWGFLIEEGRVTIVLLSFRRGVLISKRIFREPSVPNLDEALSLFLSQYYSTRPVPDEIVLSEEIADISLLQSYLKERRKEPVRVYGPHDGRAADLVKLAIENLHEAESQATLDQSFKRILHLKEPPKRIEVYDISHTHGSNPSGIMVVFQDFKPKKDGYRVFHIRDAGAEDDVGMMREVLTRRLTDEKIVPLPELIILDGGKGQIAAVLGVLKTLGIQLDLIGIAKGERRRRMEDIIYLPLRKNPLMLPRSSPVFKEIVKMRDEAHRFAITSHKKWKRREDLGSSLEAIQGVGKKRTTALLKQFPSFQAMTEAGVEGISVLPGFNRKVAERIVEGLKNIDG